MNQETQGKSNWIAILGAVAIILAAIIGLGMPFAERLADRYLPTFTPVVVLITPTNQTISIATLPSSSTQLPTSEIISQVNPISYCPSFSKGETRLVSKDTIIQGDIYVNGQQLFRNVDNEGTVAYFGVETSVTAPYGAKCVSSSLDFIDSIVEEELNYGCTGGCLTVQKVIFSDTGKQEEIVTK